MNRVTTIINIVIVSIVVLAATGALHSQQSKYEGKIVRKIMFEGLRNSNAEDLLYVMKTTVGYPLKAQEVREDIRKIFEKGKFESVRVEADTLQDGVQLKIICKERPVIRSLVFKGTDDVSDTDLTSAIPMKEGDILRKDYLQRSINAIKKKYEEEGLFNASVRYTVEPIKGDENSVKVTFVIDEGEEVRVRKIAILGARNIYPKELLAVMETAEKSLFKDGAFKKEKYEEDKAKIVGYYKQNGYLDASIVEDSVEYEWVDPRKKDKRGIFITIKISEGQRYYFDGYTVKVEEREGGPVFTTKEIRSDFELVRVGEVFNETTFQRDRQSISFKYATRGYIFTRVQPERIITESNVEVNGTIVKRKFMKISFTIEEGSQAYIDLIIVKGNKKTKDKVIRRELAFKEGELFDSRKMQVSREKVYNLGFFKQVNIDVRPGSREGYMNLIIDVEEQPTGTISLGGGYGTTSGFSIFADVGENNLLGNGQRVGVRFEYGPEKRSLTLSFGERWLFGQPLGLNASVFYYQYIIKSNSTLFQSVTKETTYKKDSFGYSLGPTYRFFHYYTMGTSWSHAFQKVHDVTGESADEIFRLKKFKWQQKRTITMFVARDSRDNYLNPTSGGQIDLSVGFTGGPVLGGDHHFVRFDPDASYYFSPFHLPFLKSHPVVLELRASGSFIVPPINSVGLAQSQNRTATAWSQRFLEITNPDVRQNLSKPWLEPEDRMNLGGPETLRGWDYYDKRFPKSWQNVGLFHRILFGAELRVPIHPQMLWTALFFDAGSLWSDPFWEKELSYANLQIINTDRGNYLSNTLYNSNYLSTTLQSDLGNYRDFGKKKLYRLDEIGKMGFVPFFNYFRYSYGFGFRVQIPMMPLRFWFGRKFIVQNGKVKHLSGFTFQFAIGDQRW